MAEDIVNRQHKIAATFEDLMGSFCARLLGRTFQEERALLKNPELDLYPSVIEVLAEELLAGTELPEALVENRGNVGKESIDFYLNNNRWDLLRPLGRSTDYILAATKRAYGDDEHQFLQVAVTDGPLTDEQREEYAEVREPKRMEELWTIVMELKNT